MNNRECVVCGATVHGPGPWCSTRCRRTEDGDERDFGPPESQETTMDLSHVLDVCKLSQGPTCCSFLVIDEAGFECAKTTPLEPTIRFRRATGGTKAMGDNCHGDPDRAAA